MMKREKINTSKQKRGESMYTTLKWNGYHMVGDQEMRGSKQYVQSIVIQRGKANDCTGMQDGRGRRNV